MGKGSIKESFIRIENGEIILYGMHITPYEKGNIFKQGSSACQEASSSQTWDQQDRGKLQEKGLTLVPLKVYFKGSLVKVEVGVARGKKLYDKRQDIAKKDHGERQKENSKSKICNFKKSMNSQTISWQEFDTLYN